MSLISQEETANRFLLPEDFKVYVGSQGVVNYPYPGLTEKTLKTRNIFQRTPGCYIACYSKDAEKGIYSVGDGIYVMGQIRVKGRYVERVCKPDQYETKDISAEKKFKDLCNKHIPECVNNCWAGGDTGGWFGIQ